MWAVERDPAALEWAARNVATTGLAVEVVAGDMADALAELDGTVDVVVSNPPYLPLDLLDELEPEVRDHDPAAGAVRRRRRARRDPDGRSRRSPAAAPGRTRRRRTRRPTRARAHPDCFQSWHDVTDHLDLAGRPRYLTAVHP